MEKRYFTSPILPARPGEDELQLEVIEQRCFDVAVVSSGPTPRLMFDSLRHFDRNRFMHVYTFSVRIAVCNHCFCGTGSVSRH